MTVLEMYTIHIHIYLECISHMKRYYLCNQLPTNDAICILIILRTDHRYQTFHIDI